MPPMGTGDFFPMVKQLGCKDDHLFPFSAEFKNAWSYTITHIMHIQVGCGEKFTFLL